MAGQQGQIWGAVMGQAGGTWEIGLSLLGGLIAQGNYAKADKIYQQIVDSLSAEEVPKFKEMVAQELPQAREVLGMGEGRSAQSQALQKLSSFVDQGGLDAQARAQNEEALSAADQRAKANRGATMQQFARRGMSGGGNELAAMMQGDQAAANQGRQASLDIAGQARQRALQALGQQAQLGTSMRGQDIDVESKNAAAANAREQFNAKMRYAAMGANNDFANQDFRNRMAKQNAVNQAKGTVAQRYLQGAAQTRKDFASVGRGINYKHQQGAEDIEGMGF